MKTLLYVILGISIHSVAIADCVYGAKDKTKFSRLDNHTSDCGT